MCTEGGCSWLIPFGGNAFVQNPFDPKMTEFIEDEGLSKWTNPDSVISVYFYSTRGGQVLVALRLKVPSGSSIIELSLADRTKPQQWSLTWSKVKISGSEYQIVPFGQFQIHAGYTRFDLQGVSKTGEYFADVSDLFVVPVDGQTELKFVDDTADFYFGRRGPSVHLFYILPPSMEGKNVEYFYSELTVPEGQDVMGAYFCSIGFNGGYFGIQVNSPEERRVLFSVWSDYETDNPEDIPPEYRVELLRKGNGVSVSEFGDEGSGGQSYLVYPWKSDTTYRFLVHGIPLDDENTIFTAWFNPTGKTSEGWVLIASFLKPKYSTYLGGFYSFSENFIPEMGDVERRCVYGNQWARDSAAEWTEVVEAEFSADDIATRQLRNDISGGIEPNSRQFFLRNCGFFSDSTELLSKFTRSPGPQPQIDFDSLP